jgi:hypothetical protein
MKAQNLLLFIVSGLLANAGFCGIPAIEIIQGGQRGRQLLHNGNFELERAGKPQDWIPATGGFAWVAGEGREGSHGLRCDNAAAAGWMGASQTLDLNRSNAYPLVVRGWSKAQDVSGSADSGYSLYVDIVYPDGTPLWGQTANFRTGTHDWQERQVVILPQKPVKSLTLHCILRGHSGKAWFDDVSVEEISGPEAAGVFEGVPIRIARERQLAERAPDFRAQTQDGLELQFAKGAVQSLRVGGVEVGAGTASGFLARDVAAGSSFYSFNGIEGECPDLRLRMEAECKAERDYIAFEGRVADTSGGDRAITLLFALPIDASGWRWGDDIRHDRVIGTTTEMGNMVSVGCGATGTMSLYPFAAIWNRQNGLALGVDMSKPAQYRLCYHPGTKQLYLAWDFGLVPETVHFPGSAEFRFVVFRFNPEWGFRAAWRKFMEIFPAQFTVRSKDQGIWMPFTDVSTVEGWEDFGFKYHEGNNNVPWDDTHGVLSFRYTEPMTWWMPMPKGTPRTIKAALRTRDELAKQKENSSGRMAQMTGPAAMWDETGQPALSFRDTPWCDGAVWSLNPNPDLPSVPGEGNSTWNAATVHWNAQIKARLYGRQAKGEQDGEYLDSLEGYVTTDLNFRREHFRYTTVPLTFASDTKEPALFKGLAVFEFTKWLSQEIHGMHKLMFANGVPYRFSFLCPWLDVLGTETDWLREGKYSPPADSQMSFWRTMSGAKPYLLLMNTDYDKFTPELVEKYFQRSLFYGMFPSMFSHNAAENPYWQNPKWYNRDRQLFKRYIPIIKQVAEAGWQPVTWVTSADPNIHVERFGPASNGTLFLSFLNDSGQRRTAEIRFDLERLGIKRDSAARNLLTGATTRVREAQTLTLQPQEATVLEFANP